MLLLAFLLTATATLVLTGGYLVLLGLTRRPAPQARRLEPSRWPSLAIVVPTLNEAGWIEGKLADLERGTPAGLPIVVLDGGSGDGTLDVVRRHAARNASLTLVSLPFARSKADQINHALATRGEDVLVVTDVDSRLEPGCLDALVSALAADPETVVAGAVVRPDSRLPEEVLHWRIVNRLWWLEGEAASATGLSGVCYAVRRADVRAIHENAVAEDAQLALSAGGRGLRVRIVPEALAVELRVPQDDGDFVAYRRRRGAALTSEWRRPLAEGAPLLFRMLVAARAVQLAALPALVLLDAALAACLIATADGWATLPVLALFALVALAASRPLPGTPGADRLRVALPIAACRLTALLVSVLLGGLRDRSVKERVGCSEPVI